MVEQGEAEINPLYGEPMGYADAVLKERIIERDRPKVRPIPPGSFIISADAESIEEAPFCAVRDYPTWYQVEADGRSLAISTLDQVPQAKSPWIPTCRPSPRNWTVTILWAATWPMIFGGGWNAGNAISCAG